MSVKLRRVAAGFYTATVNGHVYEITNAQTGYGSAWLLSIDGGRPIDAYNTKAEAVLALTELVQRPAVMGDFDVPADEPDAQYWADVFSGYGLMNWSSNTALPPAFPTTQEEFDYLLEDDELW